MSSSELTKIEFMYERQERTGGEVAMMLQDIAIELYEHITYNVWPSEEKKPGVYYVALDALEAMYCSAPDEIVWTDGDGDSATAMEVVEDLKLDYFLEVE